MDCPDCQRSIPDDSRFCSYCGTSLRACTNCQVFFHADALFCGRCGGNLVDAGPPIFRPPRHDSPSVLAYLYRPEDQSSAVALREGDNTVGAGGNNDIIIHKPAVSWNHAILICRHDRFLIQDSASTNGTFVNDTRLRGPKILNHEDKLRFGSDEFYLWIKPDHRSA